MPAAHGPRLLQARGHTTSLQGMLPSINLLLQFTQRCTSRGKPQPHCLGDTALHDPCSHAHGPGSHCALTARRATHPVCATATPGGAASPAAALVTSARPAAVCWATPPDGPAAEPPLPGLGETRGVSDTYATSRPLHVWRRASQDASTKDIESPCPKQLAKRIRTREINRATAEPAQSQA